MPKYVGEPQFQHDSPDRLGILLVNLGTPEAPDPPAVRRFLAEFLWDPRVVEAPRWLWWLALHGVILRIRPSKSAHAYRQIWTEQGSPLMIHSRALTEAVRERFASRSDVRVVLGMTYGNPSIPAALKVLQADGVRRLAVLPLYPQYSATTTASVFDRVAEELRHWRWLPELRFIMSYADEPAYIAALADSIREHWRLHGTNHLLFSFHGIPRRYLLAGDPYHCQCQKTARLVAEALHLGSKQWSISFQSQVGREEWLQPYTDQLLLRYAQQGPKRIDVVCPGFATDCLETLEEIALRNRDAFVAAGGEYFSYVPALNDSEAHSALLARILERHIEGWQQLASSDEAAARRERALNLGASR